MSRRLVLMSDADLLEEFMLAGADIRERVRQVGKSLPGEKEKTVGEVLQRVDTVTIPALLLARLIRCVERAERRTE